MCKVAIKAFFVVTVVFALQWSFSTEGHASKFTHPQRAYVTLSDVKVIRSPSALKKALSRKSNYQWAQPTIDGQITCAMQGKVTKINQVVDSWQMVDLGKTLVGTMALVSAPCIASLDEGTIQAEIAFSPKYRGKRMFGTSASGHVLRSQHLLNLSPNQDVDVKGYRFCLRNTQVAIYGNANTKPAVSSFEVRWIKLPATKATKAATLFFNVYGKSIANQASHGLSQESGPFAAFLLDFEADGATLKHVGIQVFQKYD
ncbi:MAG: hypothetical protein JKY56_10965 [Kofleriaceae bacterium]|nr:hypothetical protein [Kofleriaceae bacterium]